MGNCFKDTPPQLNISKIGNKSSLQLNKQSAKKSQFITETEGTQDEVYLKFPSVKLVISQPSDQHSNENEKNEENIVQRNSFGSNSSKISSNSGKSGGLNKKNLGIQDFVINKSLGKGAFGQVYLVVKKNTDKKYAMKTIKKVDIVKQKLIEATILEKSILLRSSHPFVVSLKYCIQTEKKIYMIMEYVSGGDLYSLLNYLGVFSEKVARFIIAEVILGIQYLHDTLKIIYRDLKPENILLSKQGHIKISDFGLSKEFQNKEDKTYTFAGTPEYLAPEIILNKGHNKNVDLWGIGIFLFELIAGYPPFYDENRNVEKIQQQILTNRPAFPDSFSPNVKDLIRSLLHSDPSKRLGADSFFELKEHPFFCDLDWDALLRQQTDSPLKKYAENEKSLKVSVRNRQIIETPLKENIELPQINGMTYEYVESLKEKEIENQDLTKHFDCQSPKNNQQLLIQDEK